ncbi:MAG: sulfatase-like hydrolase/transferase [Bacteroidota bacterium]
MKNQWGTILLIAICYVGMSCNRTAKQERERLPKPNILLLMSDNHYVDHLGCYGDPVVKTPTIDRLAKEGVRFTHAFCGSPSCTPARSALLAGQDIWRLGEGGNLWSTLADSIPIYTDLLEEIGYHVGHDRKGWGPGDFAAGGRSRNPAGYTFQDFGEFLSATEATAPWCYWLSSKNPHRPFTEGSGIASGMDPNQVVVPPYLPDVAEVRSDICDYYHEIQDFDREVAEAIALVKERGELDRTVIMICGDNGWMMPRGLANLYDFGTRVPLIISWPDKFPSGRVVSDFVSLNDLAPTILELAGLPIPSEMTAQSLTSILHSEKEGQIETNRDFIVTARERHALVRKGGLGYPGRAIRTKDFLYIHNITPDRWPAGDPPLFGDIDLHMLHKPTPTKEYMMEFKDRKSVWHLYEMAFLKRAEEELFDLRTDPYQMKNLAYDPTYQSAKEALKLQLQTYLTDTKDPRVLGQPALWDEYHYYKDKDWVGTPRKEAQEKFGLKAEYSYRK